MMTLKAMKKVVKELNGYLKKAYDFNKDEEFGRAYADLRWMFTLGSKSRISGLWINVNAKYGIEL